MRHMSFLAGATVFAIVAASAMASEPPRTFTASADPFGYCITVGTVDNPAGGDGPAPIPSSLDPYLPAALGLADDARIAPRSAYWRCMDGAVYVCVTGANLVCDRKADRAMTNAGADTYCRDNPDAATVPAYAVGHGSLFEWHCRAGHAWHGPPTGKLDRRGFRIDIWHKVARTRAATEQP